MSLQALAGAQIAKWIESIHEDSLVFDSSIAALLKAHLRDVHLSARPPLSATKTKIRIPDQQMKPLFDHTRQRQSYNEQRSSRFVSEKHTEQLYDADALPNSSPSRPLSSTAYDPFLPSQPLERVSGIDWAVASPAQSLLANAHLLASQSSARQQPLTIRSMFIESVGFMLRSLPQNLTDMECERIRESLPSCNEQKFSWVTGVRESNNNADKSFFRRSMAQLFMLVALLFALLVPTIVRLVRWGYQIERKHRITGRLLVVGLRGLDSMGENFLDVKDAVDVFQRGRLGITLRLATTNTFGRVCSALNSIVTYAVDGIGGGIWDGATQAVGAALMARAESGKL